MANRLEGSPPERSLSHTPSPACLTSLPWPPALCTHTHTSTLWCRCRCRYTALSCAHTHNTDTTDAYLFAPLQLPDVRPQELQQRSQYLCVISAFTYSDLFFLLYFSSLWGKSDTAHRHYSISRLPGAVSEQPELCLENHCA